MNIIISENQLKHIINENIDLNEKFIIAYHGTDQIINKFTDDFMGNENAKDANGPGIYFSNNKFDSEHYGNYLYTVRLNSNNFLTDKNKKNFPINKAIKLIKMKKDWELDAQNWNPNPNIGLNIFLKNIFDDNDNSKDILLEIWGDYYRYSPKEFARNCTKLNIDGINTTNYWGGGGSSEHYIIYNPNIIEILNVENLNSTND